MALAVLRPNDINDDRRYLAATASASTAVFGGLDEISLALSDFDLKLNQARGSKEGIAATALNWAADIDLDGQNGFGDIVDPGKDDGDLSSKSTQAIEFTEDFLRVEVAVDDFSVFDFFHGSGDLVFERSSHTVALSDESNIDTQMLTFTATSLNAFVGINDPETSEDAVGCFPGRC